MRLIDADKLELKHYIQRVNDKVIRYNGTQPEYANYDILAHDIANAPTVKAITIEWIKNYARHKASKGFTEIDCYWQSWEDDVLEMVADWEKENEHKESD